MRAETSRAVPVAREVFVKRSIPSVAFVAAVLSSPSAVAQVITRVSTSTGCGIAEDQADSPAIDAQGCRATFVSRASNLVPGDVNGKLDVFLRDLCLSTTICVSVRPDGAPGNGDSVGPATISADGRHVAFASDASDLVPGDTNGQRDVFVRDLVSGVTTRISVSSSGAESDGYSDGPEISGDGRFVVFESYATNFDPADRNTWPDVYLHDRDPDGNGVFDEGNAVVRRVSIPFAGGATNGNSLLPSISADARTIAFYSDATNLLSGVTNWPHIYVFDRTTGSTTLADVDVQGMPSNGLCLPGPISSNGRFIAFESFASDLVPNDTNGKYDTFVRDLVAGTTERVSVTSSGAQGTNDSYAGSVSDDGRYVVFSSAASLAPPSAFWTEVYVRDRLLSTTIRVQASPTLAPVGSSDEPRIAPDGRAVVFASEASNLVADGGGGAKSAFLFDMGIVTPASTTFCLGDGSAGPCPCGNSGSSGHGCDNSAGTGGAVLTATGTTSPDTIRLLSASELASVTTVFVQGTVQRAPVNFGDGLRCIGGNLKRLASTQALGGNAVYTSCPKLPVSVRSAALGDPIPAGATRYYMAYYRDSSAAFCPAPQGNLWNASQALSIVW
jgi:Tol biopolymer transport system component